MLSFPGKPNIQYGLLENGGSAMIWTYGQKFSDALLNMLKFIYETIKPI